MNPISSNEFDGRIQDVMVYFGACKYTATNIGDQHLFQQQPPQIFSQTLHQV